MSFLGVGWEQWLIAIFGATAIWVTQQKRADLKKWACVLGMITQPAWFYSAYTSEQWGIFFVSFLYTYSWGLGIFNNFIGPYYDSKNR